MRFISIKDAKPGMFLAYDLFDSQGRTLIGSKCELTESFIEKLSDLGFCGVYINDEISEDIEIEPAISPSLRRAARDCVQRADIDACAKVAKQIVEELLSGEKISLDLADLRSFDDYTFAHSVNVAIICCAIGIEMNLDAKTMDNLVMAALLHDLGKLVIDQNIINKPGRLTKEEYEIIKTHSQKSYEIIADRLDLSSHVKQAVLFHHENYDGSGYPQGLSGNDISLLCRILHVADVFDAMISDRPYKKGYATSEAAEYLMGAGGILFDREIVEHFIHIVPFYPKGSEVVLSNGERCVVVENSGLNNMRPIVRSFENRQQYNLMDHQYLNITIQAQTTIDKAEIERMEEERKAMVTREKRKTLLLVDDMLTNLNLLRDILGGKYDLILAKSGRQAISYVEDHGCPDLILMDIDMPGMNGLDAAKAIQRIEDQKAAILFVTAKCDRETVIQCQKVRAAGYVARPFNSIFIKEEVERILSTWGK